MLTPEQKRLCSFIDINKRKQKTQKVDGKNIVDAAYLKNIDQTNISIIVTAVWHFQSIQNFLDEIKFKGDLIKIF